MIPALEFIDHGFFISTLWPRLANSSFTETGIRFSNDKSPGYIVCGKGEAGKLRVVQRGASIASWMFIPKSTMFTNVCKVFYKRECQEKNSPVELEADKSSLAFSPWDGGVDRMRLWRL